MLYLGTVKLKIPKKSSFTVKSAIKYNSNQHNSYRKTYVLCKSIELALWLVKSIHIPTVMTQPGCHFSFKLHNTSKHIWLQHLQNKNSQELVNNLPIWNTAYFFFFCVRTQHSLKYKYDCQIF
jgi:hypothetical protein